MGAARFAASLTLLSALLAQPAWPDPAESNGDPMWPSASGRYRLGYTSDLEPPAINRIHRWVLHLATADGHPVANATITVSGGMPAHDHGLPTQPQVTEYLRGGDYLLEGMRFHMNGAWELRFDIEVGGNRDHVIVPLEL